MKGREESQIDEAFLKDVKTLMKRISREKERRAKGLADDLHTTCCSRSFVWIPQILRNMFISYISGLEISSI